MAKMDEKANQKVLNTANRLIDWGELKAKCSHRIVEVDLKTTSVYQVDRPSTPPKCERTGGYCVVDSCPIFDAYRVAKRIGRD